MKLRFDLCGRLWGRAEQEMLSVFYLNSCGSVRVLILAISVATVAPLYSEVHTVPPPGVEVPAADRADLESGLTKLSIQIDKLRWNPLVQDVAIYEKAIHFGLQYNEFFK